jgi:hypothetical protein
MLENKVFEGRFVMNGTNKNPAGFWCGRGSKIEIDDGFR